jgi:hypothetical protein
LTESGGRRRARRGRIAPALLAVVVIVAAARAAGAQALDAAASAGLPRPTPPAPIAASTPLDPVPGLGGRAPAPLWAPLASFVVPGLGQAAMRQDRLVAYLSLEAFAWLQYANDLAEGKRRRGEYRRLAHDVARAYFSEERPVGSFDYYERMEHYVESGVFEVEAGGALDPEPDTLTYNGFIWQLARQTYWDDPDVPPDPTSPAYANALEFYRRRAVTPEYRWSWRGAQLEQDLFRRTIARSNDAFRRSVSDLGLVLANHVLSAVDASISLRLRRRGGPVGGARGLGLEASLPWPAPAR